MRHIIKFFAIIGGWTYDCYTSQQASYSEKLYKDHDSMQWQHKTCDFLVYDTHPLIQELVTEYSQQP
jgi:hypothetical protein